MSHPNGLPKDHQEDMGIAAIQTIISREKEFCPKNPSLFSQGVISAGV